MQDPLFMPIVRYVKHSRLVLDKPGSPTGSLVSRWAKLMVLPQFALAPFTLLFGRIEGPLIFLTRFIAMHIVIRLEGRVPFTRALGLCHLLTFGPLFAYFTWNFSSIYAGWGAFAPLFAIEYAIIGLCLCFDLRDLILHAAGRPFPCYVRDHHRLGNIHIDDARVEQPVNAFSMFLW